jgi:hypothetical protein
VRGRALLGVVAGGLLAAPLVVIIVHTVWQRTRAPVPEELEISPVLSFEERLKLVTYQRECGKQKPCEPPLGCLPYPGLFKAYCTDSECVTDAQCREGFSCQVLLTWGSGPRVRACVPVGIRQEGQRCTSIPADREEACGPGLVCGADWCGRPCKTEEPTSCSEGFFCADVPPGPLCLPSCEARGCPEGQHCVSFNQGASTCVLVHGAHCRQSGCGAGQECVVLQREDRPGEVWMNCSTPCGEDKPPCAEGTICHRSYCRRPCDPDASGDCEPGYHCGRFEAAGPWVCRFDRRRTRSPSGVP